jgi:N-dimethylarginine dimethylaminohydrolase
MSPGLRNEGDALRRAAVCAPKREYTRVDDPVKQNFVEVPDEARARLEHEGLRHALEAAGVQVHEVPELAGHPNSVFVRDVALAAPGGFIRLRMGLPARRGEDEWMAGHLSALGIACVGSIEPPGLLEGGDVFMMGKVALVGLSSRANAEGVLQLERILEPLGCRVRTAEVPAPYFHLGSILSPVGPERVVCIAGTLPGRFLDGLDVIEAPADSARPASANVLCLGSDEVLADTTESPRTLEALEAAGVRVHALELSEFAKGSGGPTCLVLPLERG